LIEDCFPFFGTNWFFSFSAVAFETPLVRDGIVHRKKSGSKRSPTINTANDRGSPAELQEVRMKLIAGMIAWMPDCSSRGTADIYAAGRSYRDRMLKA
jgi:hypothetical protein